MGTATLKAEPDADISRREFLEHQSKYQQEQLSAQLRRLQMQHQSIQRPLEVNVYAQPTTPKKTNSQSPISLPPSQHLHSPGGSSVCEALHNVSMGSIHSDFHYRVRS
jgi:hypothetical protein